MKRRTNNSGRLNGALSREMVPPFFTLLTIYFLSIFDRLAVAEWVVKAAPLSLFLSTIAICSIANISCLALGLTYLRILK